MKRKLNCKNMDGELRAQRVHFDYVFPEAGRVALAGTFNDWRPEATRMIALGEGRWAKELLLPPGTYEYRVVVDGVWMPDPLAVETTPNPFGGVNSVRKVGNGG
jgi:1,4-alpha-glucan branching enzyme